MEIPASPDFESSHDSTYFSIAVVVRVVQLGGSPWKLLPYGSDVVLRRPRHGVGDLWQDEGRKDNPFENSPVTFKT